MHPYKNKRMLQEASRDGAIELFLIKYHFSPLDGFPRCTLGHLRSVLAELEVIPSFEDLAGGWNRFLRLVYDEMYNSGNAFAYEYKLAEEIPERMLEYVHVVLFRFYRDKLDKRKYNILLTEIYGHPFFNHKFFS